MPGDERRPGMGTEAATMIAGSGISDDPTLGTDNPRSPSVELRSEIDDASRALAALLPPPTDADIETRHGGIVRATFECSAAGTCLVCGRVFGSTGTAAAHARAARHQVACTYSTRFAFAPVELLDGAE